jgi:hypothetical protein
MRPESSLIIRSAAISSTLIAAVLTLLWLLANHVTGDKGKHLDAIAATLVIIPGLLTVLSARDMEHPLTTSMVFGLRVLAIVPGGLAFLAAGELLFGHPRSLFGILLFGAAWLVAIVLIVAWRLAARGRPDEAAVS